MTEKDYELIATGIWRAGFVKDKNQIRQKAKTDRSRLIAINICSSLKHIDPNFDREQFMKNCGLSY